MYINKVRDSINSNNITCWDRLKKYKHIYLLKGYSPYTILKGMLQKNSVLSSFTRRGDTHIIN